MNTNLLDTTLELARTTPLSVTSICRETGVKPRWYYMLLNGDIKDPSVRRVQRLHDYLRANATDTANPAEGMPDGGKPSATDGAA